MNYFAHGCLQHYALNIVPPPSFVVTGFMLDGQTYPCSNQRDNVLYNLHFKHAVVPLATPSGQATKTFQIASQTKSQSSVGD